MKPPKADLHIHPFLKPYGHSYYENNNKNDAFSGASPWMQDKDTDLDDLLENSAGFAPYRQSDLSSCKEGNFKFIINSFYAIEQGFLDAQSDVVDTVAGKTLANIITEFGKDWITIIKSKDYNYFQDIIKQMDYAKELNGKLPINGISKYRVLDSGMDIEKEVMDGDLIIINSIEGAQGLCNGNNPGDANQWSGIETRVAQLKAHDCRPFFITFTHHFYNGLCSHSESLFDLKKIIRGQGLGMTTLKARTWEGKDYPHLSDTEITTLGYSVIELLLSAANGPVILIDVKHMSELARKEFYAYRKKNHADIPIVYSHGACQKFYNHEINLSENDIREIAFSKGIIGLELDQRIIGYNDSLPKFRIGRWLGNIFRSDHKQNTLWSKPLWDNLIFIAETCYAAGLTADPWKYICIGSDYDGIINPLNEFRTIDKIDDLLTILQDYLVTYWKKDNPIIPLNTGGEPSDIMYNIGYKNLLQFIKANFK